MIFSHIFLSILINIGLFFIYCKNTNPILKYSVFVKKMFFFVSCIRLSLSKLKKNHIVFSYNKENFKQYILACILALVTSLLKSREVGQYFKNKLKNIYIFCFNVWD